MYDRTSTIHWLKLLGLLFTLAIEFISSADSAMHHALITMHLKSHGIFGPSVYESDNCDRLELLYNKICQGSPLLLFSSIFSRHELL